MPCQCQRQTVPVQHPFSESVMGHCVFADSIGIDSVGHRLNKAARSAIVLWARDCVLPPTVFCLKPGVFVEKHWSVQQVQRETDMCIP